MNFSSILVPPRRNSTNRQGFTLIDLLIVIAISLILIAIALPNFMAARIRAQVVRVKEDMKTIVHANEAHRAQNGRYILPCLIGDEPNPFGLCTGAVGGYNSGPLWYNLDASGLTGVGIRLTTPTAFLTELPIDPFMERALSLPRLH